MRLFRLIFTCVILFVMFLVSRLQFSDLSQSARNKYLIREAFNCQLPCSFACKKREENQSLIREYLDPQHDPISKAEKQSHGQYAILMTPSLITRMTETNVQKKPQIISESLMKFNMMIRKYEYNNGYILTPRLLNMNCTVTYLNSMVQL